MDCSRLTSVSRFVVLVLLAVSLSATAQTQRKRSSARTTTVAKKTQGKTTSKKTQTQKPPTKKQLQNERANTERKRKQSQEQLKQLNRSIRANLDSVLILDNQMSRQRKTLDSLTVSISTLNQRIDTLEANINKLSAEVQLRKQRYAKALVNMRRTRSVQDKIMFVFSADNFAQLLRRTRYLHEYSAYQKAQGQMLREKQNELARTQAELVASKTTLQGNLFEVQQRQNRLSRMKSSCETKVTFLNKNLSTVQQQIKEYEKREAAINAEIDRIIQAEIEAARRAEAERQRKAEEARRKAEEARRKAVAEARERARRLAEAKAARNRAEEAARRARTAEEKAAARAASQRAEREMAEAKTASDAAEKAVREERTRSEVWKNADAGSAKLSSSFAANKGRLQMPISGSYSVVGHYGNYTVAGLRNVMLNNKGIDIRGKAGCQACAVFNGEVSSVFTLQGTYIVMLRHGSYISVYSGLHSVSVSKGQRVTTRQALGAVAANSDGNYVLQFQLRHEKERLNPEAWVR